VRRTSGFVRERTRQGRCQPERTCTGAAVPWPHRVGTVLGCYGDLVCYHGLPMTGHPDYDGPCLACDREEAGDIAFDRWRDERAR
jgi:hypothetical protein